MSTKITVSYEKSGWIAFLCFIWTINQSVLSENFSEALRLVADFKDIPLLFDLSAVAYINSGFVGHVSELYSCVDENGGKMVIVGNPVINDTFNLVGFREFVSIVDTRKEAVDELHSFLRIKAFDFQFTD